MRVVTLLPSATDIVLALGQADALVGISHSCDPPGDLADLPRMTRTVIPDSASSEAIDACVRDRLEDQTALYELRLDRLEAAAPDVIISQALCDVCAVSTGDVEAAVCSLSSRPELVDLNPQRLQDVLDDLLRVGDALACRDRARREVAALQSRIERVTSQTCRVPDARRPRVAFLEWLIPPFNGGHWNPELVELAGAVDLLGNVGAPSRTLTFKEIEATAPEVLVVACCGFPVDRALEDVERVLEEPRWAALPAVRNKRIFLADGQAYFARPGPGLVDALERLAVTLHPNLEIPGAEPFCPMD